MKVTACLKQTGQPLKISAAANQTHSFDEQIHSISMQGGRDRLANNNWIEPQYADWASDSWNDNPTETTDHKVFETGDTFQIYPGDRDAKVAFSRSSFCDVSSLR